MCSVKTPQAKWCHVQKDHLAVYDKVAVLHSHLHLYLLVKKEKCAIWSSNSQKFIREYLLAKLKTTRIFQWRHDRIKLRWFFLNGVLLHSYTVSHMLQVSVYSRSQWFDIDFKATLFLFIYTVALCDWQFLPCLYLNPIFVSITGFGYISREKKGKDDRVREIKRCPCWKKN